MSSLCDSINYNIFACLFGLFFQDARFFLALLGGIWLVYLNCRLLKLACCVVNEHIQNVYSCEWQIIYM